jgi:replicative DNA helicase
MGNIASYEDALIGAVVSAGRLPSTAVSAADIAEIDASKIWRCILELNQRGEPLDLVRISDEVRLQYDGEGTFGKLMQVTDGLADPSSLNWYAQKVLSASKIRSLKNVVSSVLSEDNIEFKAAAERIESALVSLAGSDWTGLKSIHKFAEEHIDNLLHSGFGIMSGFNQLDQNLMGFKPGHYYIIGGRPSNGKTLLALEIALNICKQHRVAYFLLETSGAQLASRALSITSGVRPVKLLRKDLASKEDWAKIIMASDSLNESALLVDESPDLSVANLRPRLLSAKDAGCNVAIIDYLQLVDSRGPSEREKMNAISSMVRRLSKDLEMAIIVLSQLSRRAQYEKPTMGHLKESGNLEADADAVILVYRHLELPRTEKWFGEYDARVEEMNMLNLFNPEDKEEIIWVELAKNRQSGLLTTIPMIFKRQYGLLKES